MASKAQDDKEKEMRTSVCGSTHQELVDAHAGVDGDFAAEVALELLLLHRLGRIVRQQLRQTLHTPRARTEAEPINRFASERQQPRNPKEGRGKMDPPHSP